MTQLRSVTRHMGSHSVTCYPTQVNAPRLHPSQAGWGEGGWILIILHVFVQQQTECSESLYKLKYQLAVFIALDVGSSIICTAQLFILFYFFSTIYIRWTHTKISSL